MPFGTLTGKKHCPRRGLPSSVNEKRAICCLASGCSLSALVIVTLQLYFMTISFMLDEG